MLIRIYYRNHKVVGRLGGDGAALLLRRRAGYYRLQDQIEELEGSTLAEALAYGKVTSAAKAGGRKDSPPFVRGEVAAAVFSALDECIRYGFWCSRCQVHHVHAAQDWQCLGVKDAA